MPGLAPAHILHEVVDCPRLTYLDRAEGSWDENVATAAGSPKRARPDRSGARIPDTTSDVLGTGIGTRLAALTDTFCRWQMARSSSRSSNRPRVATRLGRSDSRSSPRPRRSRSYGTAFATRFAATLTRRPGRSSYGSISSETRSSRLSRADQRRSPRAALRPASRSRSRSSGPVTT